MNAIEIASKIVKEFEGCAFRAYQDIGGTWTIGYGCIHNVTPEMVIGQAEADQRLLEDLESAQVAVILQIHVPLNANQHGALISFCYNEGAGHLHASTVERCINMHDYAKAADAFLLWDKCRGVTVPGLLRRREAERALFLSTSTA